MNLEKKILKHLIYDEEYTRKVLPFIKSEYFGDQSEKVLFEQIQFYVTKYNAMPSREALEIEIDNRANLTDDQHKSTVQLIKEISAEEITNDRDWLIDETETFCQEKAIYNGIMRSIQILDNKNTKESLDKGSIPTILADALSVSFDHHVGHDFLDDAENRYDFYHKVEKRIPFDLDYLNRITKNGLPEKSLNIVLAGTGVGKSLFMCHCAAANLSIGKNVLYITLEMAEERIAERIDANLMNIEVDRLTAMPKDTYLKKIERIHEKTTGKLIIKEYPTASANVNHFKHLLNELKLKRQFIPDIIYIDYLNICSSARMKMGNSVNSYTYIKAIAEELRGLAVESKLPIVSATQTTRSGYASSDVDLTDTSESFGLPATADLMFALISTEELEDLNQIMVKQLKNRYNDPTTNKRFVIGVDRAKMKLYDVEQTAQTDILDSGQVDQPVFDKSDFGKRMKSHKYEGFKI
jgi:archaellum biogenesis ATPase FlaH